MSFSTEFYDFMIYDFMIYDFMIWWWRCGDGGDVVMVVVWRWWRCGDGGGVVMMAVGGPTHSWHDFSGQIL